MIDFFVKEAISDEETSVLLQQVFNLTEDRVVIWHLQDLENSTKKLPISCECLGIKSLMGGDACTLLQVYQIEISLDTFLTRLQSFCKINSITCYVPSENVYASSYYNYYKITPDREMIEVSEWLKYDDDNKRIYFHNALIKN